MAGQSHAIFVFATAQTAEVREIIDRFALYPEACWDEDGATFLDFSELPNSGLREARQLAQAGIAFIAIWEASVAYQSGARCFVPGHGHVEVATDSCLPHPVPLVHWQANGPDHTEMIRARRFHELVGLFRGGCRLGAPSTSSGLGCFPCLGS
jgi:hypothetical protein